MSTKGQSTEDYKMSFYRSSTKAHLAHGLQCVRFDMGDRRATRIAGFRWMAGVAGGTCRSTH